MIKASSYIHIIQKKGAISMKARTKLLLFFLVLLAAGSGAYVYHAHETDLERERAAHLKISGNVDIREVTLAFRPSERISEILVDEGAAVEEGQLLARLDAAELTLSLQRAKAQTEAQRALCEKLKNGTRSEEIRQAEENVRAAAAASANARGVYARMLEIYETSEGISLQELDNARAAAESAEAKTRAAEAALEEACTGARSEDIQQAEATLAALRAEEERLSCLLTQYELRAPSAGVIRSRLLEIGDMASPAAPVFKLSLIERKQVRVYVPEADLGRIREGQKALVTMTSAPDKTLTGTVGFISPTAEFTPKTVETEELRTSLVYEVRISVDDPDNRLRLGMPVNVQVDL